MRQTTFRSDLEQLRYPRDLDDGVRLLPYGLLGQLELASASRAELHVAVGADQGLDLPEAAGAVPVDTCMGTDHLRVCF